MGSPDRTPLSFSTCACRVQEPSLLDPLSFSTMVAEFRSHPLWIHSHFQLWLPSSGAIPFGSTLIFNYGSGAIPFGSTLIFNYGFRSHPLWIHSHFQLWLPSSGAIPFGSTLIFNYGCRVQEPSPLDPLSFSTMVAEFRSHPLWIHSHFQLWLPSSGAIPFGSTLIFNYGCRVQEPSVWIHVDAERGTG